MRYAPNTTASNSTGNAVNSTVDPYERVYAPKNEKGEPSLAAFLWQVLGYE